MKRVIHMIKLKNNISIPQIGLGVFKIEPGAQMNDVIKYAYNIGYRLFDTAQMYHNEDALGNAIQANLIDRNDIFLSAKLITAAKAMKTQLQVFMILCQS